MADTNVKYLKENHLYEAHKQFMRMVEGYGYAAPVEEAGDDDDNNNQNQQPDPNQSPMGGDNPMGDNSDPLGNGDNQQPPMDNSPMAGADDTGNDSNQLPMGNDANGMPQDDSQDLNGDNAEIPPIDDQPMDDNSDSDDTEVDVTDIVKAQEKGNNKVNDVGRDLGTVDRRIEKLLGALEDMQGVIDRNNAEIEDLKNEFEKRNPTQTERLNLRSLDSYPFNVRPTDYWAQKAKEGNYSAYADNDEPTTKEYVITNDDVDDVDSNIDKTFDIPDDDIQDFNKIFNLK